MTSKQADQILVDITNDKGGHAAAAASMAARARKEFSKTWRETETRCVNSK